MERSYLKGISFAPLFMAMVINDVRHDVITLYNDVNTYHWFLVTLTTYSIFPPGISYL